MRVGANKENANGSVTKPIKHLRVPQSLDFAGFAGFLFLDSYMSGRMMNLARNIERVSFLIRVSKEEAMEIRKRFPDMRVSRTCKQHPRKSTYYATETSGVLNLLAQLRGRPVETSWNGTDAFDGHKVKED